jgi:hypothetical protein
MAFLVVVGNTWLLAFQLSTTTIGILYPNSVDATNAFLSASHLPTKLYLPQNNFFTVSMTILDGALFVVKAAIEKRNLYSIVIWVHYLIPYTQRSMNGIIAVSDGKLLWVWWYQCR